MRAEAGGAFFLTGALRPKAKGRDRRDRMRQFKAAWERFAADEANLVEFLNAKRRWR
jgi:hypothetical protein